MTLLSFFTFSCSTHLCFYLSDSNPLVPPLSTPFLPIAFFSPPRSISFTLPPVVSSVLTLAAPSPSSSSAKLTLFLLLSFSLCTSLAADVLPVSLCACRPSAVHLALLLQLSVSPSAYNNQASDELSSNQSMSFSPSNSAQPVPRLDSGPSPAHSSPGGSRQVSVEGSRSNIQNDLREI